MTTPACSCPKCGSRLCVDCRRPLTMKALGRPPVRCAACQQLRRRVYLRDAQRAARAKAAS